MLIRFLIASFRRSLVVAAVLLTLCSGSSLSAEELTSGVTGLVFEDLNENGRHDDGEPGIAGVAVSDQIDVVVSGADGSYKLDTSGRFDLVVLSVPSGFKTQGPIWRRIDSEVSVDSVDFPLNRRENTTEFTFLHASDPHIEDKSLNRTQLLRQLVVDLEPDLVLITGDLVANAPGVGEERAKHDFELFLQEAGSISVPVYVVPGNRDTFGVERHNSLVSAEHPLFGKEMFRHYFGPNYYSFDWGGVHFIALDSVVYQEIWYHGHIDDTQLAWLKADLSHVASGTPVVTFQHIPFVSSAELLFGHSKNPLAPSLITVDGKTKYRHTVGNHKKVLEVLKPHRFTLALGGHLHMAERLSFEADGFDTRFHLSSAAVNGLPASRVSMDMISGVTLYTVSNGEIDNGRFYSLDAQGTESKSGMH